MNYLKFFSFLVLLSMSILPARASEKLAVPTEAPELEKPKRLSFLAGFLHKVPSEEEKAKGVDIQPKRLMQRVPSQRSIGSDSGVVRHNSGLAPLEEIEKLASNVGSRTTDYINNAKNVYGSVATQEEMKKIEELQDRSRKFDQMALCANRLKLMKQYPTGEAAKQSEVHIREYATALEADWVALKEPMDRRLQDERERRRSMVTRASCLVLSVSEATHEFVAVENA